MSTENTYDIVLPLKDSGSGHDDEELRFTLRSIEKNLKGYNKIILVTTSAPKWCTGVEVLSNRPDGGRKNICLWDKWLSGVKHSESSHVYFWSDDKVLLQPIEAGKLPQLTNNKNLLEYSPDKVWHKCLLHTGQLLKSLDKPTRNCDSHAPVLVNRQEALDLNDKFYSNSRIEPGLLFQSLYQNYYEKPLLDQGTYKSTCEDKKHTLEIVTEKSKGRMFLGYNNRGWENGVKQYLQELFPEKSKYENDDFVKTVFRETVSVKNDESFSVVTATGGRPIQFARCLKMMKRMSIKPTEWIVVDDGVIPIDTSLFAGMNYVKYIRNKPLDENTVGINLSTGIDNMTTEHLIVMEDDDYYPADYLEDRANAEDDVVGNHVRYYWHTNGSYKIFKSGRMCVTATLGIRGKSNINIIRELAVINWKNIDYRFCKRIRPEEGRTQVVGIKGSCGRKGASWKQHEEARGYSKSDTILQEWIGNDSAMYIDKDIVKMKYGICAIIKDCDEEYLKEWMEWHTIIGFNHFFIYDNNSTIPIKETLKDYKNITVYKWESDDNPHLPVYRDCIAKQQNGEQGKMDWMAFIDDDEFIMIDKGAHRIGDLLEPISVDESIGAVVLSYIVFGSSGEKKIPGLQMDKFNRHTEPTKYIKSLVKPKAISHCDTAHCFGLKAGFKQVNTKCEVRQTLLRGGEIRTADGSAKAEPTTDDAWINHYFCKSLEEFQAKRARGRADAPIGQSMRNHNRDNDNANFTEHYDKTMKIKQALTTQTVERLMQKGREKGLKIQQNVEELSSLFASIRALNTKRYLEVGASSGGSLYILAHALPVGSEICVVDLPNKKRRRRLLGEVVAGLQEDGYIVKLILGDSHTTDILEQVKTAFSGLFDVAFIDGDHSYLGVKQDYEDYGKLVKDGGLIAVHDIANTIPIIEVEKFWLSVSKELKSLAIIADIDKHSTEVMGIGIIQKNAKELKQKTIVKLDGFDFNNYWKNAN